MSLCTFKINISRVGSDNLFLTNFPGNFYSYYYVETLVMLLNNVSKNRKPGYPQMLPLGWMGETLHILKKNTNVSGLLRKAIYRSNDDIINIIVMYF